MYYNQFGVTAIIKLQAELNPKFFRTEIPVTILTSLLGLTNGYLTSVLMILAPKMVKLQHAETAGIVSVLFLVIGLAAGSVIAWFWVI
ncbi:hypothetical protein HN51_010757 [Arachis hypogaea]